MDFHAFWNGGCDNPELTAAMVADAEQRLGVRLPEEYLGLLRVQNGGYTRRFVFLTKVRTSWANDHVPFEEMNGIDSPEKELTLFNILDRDYYTREWGLPPSQVLLCGDGHWWVTLDYRRGPEPCVSWIDVEEGHEVVLADTFGDFVRGLVLTADYEAGAGATNHE